MRAYNESEVMQRLFEEEVRTKKKTARGAFKKTGGRRSKYHMLPSDFLRGKARKDYEKGGEIKMSNTFDSLMELKDFDLLTEEKKKEALLKWRKTYKNKEIMNALGVSHNIFYKIINELNLPKEPRKHKAKKEEKNTKFREKSIAINEDPNREKWEKALSHITTTEKQKEEERQLKEFLVQQEKQQKELKESQQEKTVTEKYFLDTINEFEKIIAQQDEMLRIQKNMLKQQAENTLKQDHFVSRELELQAKAGERIRFDCEVTADEAVRRLMKYAALIEGESNTYKLKIQIDELEGETKEDGEKTEERPKPAEFKAAYFKSEKAAQAN